MHGLKYCLVTVVEVVVGMLLLATSAFVDALKIPR
jgi:hypothetical protein